VFEIRLNFFFSKKQKLKKNEQLLPVCIYSYKNHKSYNYKYVQFYRQTENFLNVKTMFFIKGVLFYYFANHNF